jgi:hypothetical protein
MLKFLSSIKHNCDSIFALAATIGTLLAPARTAQAQALQTLSTEDEKHQQFSFLASARLHSPDRSFEAATPVVRINLDGSRSVVLKGRTMTVTLDTEPSGFSNAQLVRVSASGNAGQRGDGTSFTAGVFKVLDSGGHNFVFREKNKGWLLEVKLRPIETIKPKDQPLVPSRSKSPARFLIPKRPKRIPA